MITNFTGVSGSRTSCLAAGIIRDKNKALILVPDGRTADHLAEDLRFFVPEAEITVMPEAEDIQILYEARNRESLIKRIKGIQALNTSHEGPVAVIAPISAAVMHTEPPERFLESMTELAVGSVIDPAVLREKLVAAGYNYSPVTESPGEFTSRGGIIDVYPPAESHPLRIEFFDDEIDSIRSFDPDTQRSLNNLSSAVIGPAAEFIPTSAEKEKAIESIRREYDRRIRNVRADNAPADSRLEILEEHKGRVTDLFEEQSNVQIYLDFIEYFNVEKCYLWDHLIRSRGAERSGDEGTIILMDPTRIEETLPESAPSDVLNSIYKSGTSSIYSDIDVTIFTPFQERIRGIDRMDRIVNVRSRQIAPFNGQIDLFAAETGRLADSGYSITIVSSSDEKNERIKEYLDIAEVEGSISYREGSLSAGFILDDDKICYICEGDIFPQQRKAPRKRKKTGRSADSISFSDLHTGDYVVHEVHGIGRFEGIRPMTADGIRRDYLVIRYAGSDVLYIPTEQLDIIQKYIGNSGNAPALSRLSGGSWKRTRERARKAVMAIAEDLVKLYAERQAAGGYAFGPDSVWQREFEADFPYTETDDQLRATEEIKEDMEKPLPMDRLLCGDVGYGKTEVAARAIFKCISEGKQAAILAPTTLLVNQHYHNLKERFEHFPFEIDELSRFRSATEQKRICADVKEGKIDLIIGTHRILSEDVKFKDLGLLVIDEEQRFGVRHKEKIKQLRNNIDVLTLSATPIPRTLNMSLTG
ncbi:MAG: DEAD/DEAH box helicase, partial [Clostridiales bacterium]|nr:DEAD/DEAH box helicase [Clostridiales bacterium]